MKKILYIFNKLDLDFIKILSNKNLLYLYSLNDSFENIPILKNVEIISNNNLTIKKFNLRKLFVIEDIINDNLNTNQNLKFISFLKDVSNNNVIHNYNRIIRLKSDIKNLNLNMNKNIFINLIEYESFFSDMNLNYNSFYISHPMQYMINQNDNLEYLLRKMAYIAVNHVHEIKLNIFKDLFLNVCDQKIIYSFIEKNLTNKNHRYSFESGQNMKLTELIKNIATYFETKIILKESKNNFSFSVDECKSDEFKVPKNSKMIYGNYINSQIQTKNNSFVLNNKKILLKINKNHINTYFKNFFYLFLKEARVKEFNFMINDIPPSDAS